MTQEPKADGIGKPPVDELFLKAHNSLISEKRMRDHGAPVVQSPRGALPSTDEPGVLDMLGDAASAGMESMGRLFRGEAEPEFAQAVTDAETQIDNTEVDPNAEPSLHQKTVATMAAIPAGAVKAGFNTLDAFQGEGAEKSEFRQKVESLSDDLRETTTAAAIVEPLSSFVVGLLGAGRLLSPLKPLAPAGKAVQVGLETAKGAVAGYFVMDPHEERLSDLVQQFPALENPISSYLSSHPDDTATEGRMKNALEGIGLDLAVAGTFALALKAMKYLRAGDKSGAASAISELSAKERAGKKAEVGEPGAALTPDEQMQQDPQGLPLQTAGSSAVPEANLRAGQVVEVAKGMEVQAASTGAGSKSTADLLAPPSSLSSTSAARLKALPEADVATILKGAEADLLAIRAYGGREEAMAQGYRFSGETNLPWSKLNTVDEVQTLIGSAATTLKARFDEIKGGDVVSDARVQRMIQERADLFGEDPGMALGRLIQAGESASTMAAEMESSFLIASKMFQDAYTVAFKLRNGDLLEWGGDAAAAANDLRKRLTLASELLGSARSMSSAAGRSLRRMRSEFQMKPEDLALIGEMGPERLADLVYMSKGDPQKLAEFAKPAFLRRAFDEAQFSMVNSLLWLWPTHAVNVTANLYMLAARPTEKWLGSFMLGAAGSPIRQQAAKEYGYTLSALGDGLSAMLDAFKRGDSRLNPHQSTEFFSNGRGIHHTPINFQPMNSVEGVIHNAMLAINYRNIVGLPTRGLGAVDEFVKTLRYRAVVQAKASVEAAERELSGEALRQHIAGRLQRAFDDEGRATDKAALQEAQTTTFQQDLLKGTAGATIQNVRGQHPLLGFVLPFIRTPVNVLRYSHKMTPGLNLLQREYRQMLLGSLGPERQAQAIGQMAIGATFMAVAASHAANGRITGGGPSDPKLLAELKATGWQPYSVVWEDESGNKKFFPLGRFDPIGLPISIIADIVEGRKLNPEDQNAMGAAAATLLSISQKFADRTFLFNIESFLGALGDPEANLEKYMGQLAASVTPLSSLMRGANSDPYMREARSFMDYLRKDLPGLSEALPPRRDALGEPLYRRIGLVSTQEADEVDGELARLLADSGRGFQPPSPIRDGVDLRDFTLEGGRNAYDLLQETAAHPKGAPPLKEALARVIRTEAYSLLAEGDAGTKGTKLNALAVIVGRYRDAAYRQVLLEHPELRTELNRKRINAAAEVLTNKTGDPTAGERLRTALGITTKN